MSEVGSPDLNLTEALSEIDASERQQDVIDFGRVLEKYEGRKFLWTMLSQAGVYGTTFRGESTHATAFEEGKRAMGLWLLEEIFTADANAYTLMRSEADRRAREREQRVAATKERFNGDDW